MKKSTSTKKTSEAEARARYRLGRALKTCVRGDPRITAALAAVKRAASANR